MVPSSAPAPAPGPVPENEGRTSAPSPTPPRSPSSSPPVSPRPGFPDSDGPVGASTIPGVAPASRFSPSGSAAPELPRLRLPLRDFAGSVCGVGALCRASSGPVKRLGEIPRVIHGRWMKSPDDADFSPEDPPLTTGRPQVQWRLRDTDLVTNDEAPRSRGPCCSRGRGTSGGPITDFPPAGRRSLRGPGSARRRGRRACACRRAVGTSGDCQRAPLRCGRGSPSRGS